MVIEGINITQLSNITSKKKELIRTFIDKETELGGIPQNFKNIYNAEYSNVTDSEIKNKVGELKNLRSEIGQNKDKKDPKKEEGKEKKDKEEGKEGENETDPTNKKGEETDKTNKEDDPNTQSPPTEQPQSQTESSTTESSTKAPQKTDPNQPTTPPPTDGGYRNKKNKTVRINYLRNNHTRKNKY